MTAPLAAPDPVTCAAGTPGAHEHRYWAGMGLVLRADARAGAEWAQDITGVAVNPKGAPALPQATPLVAHGAIHGNSPLC